MRTKKYLFIYAFCLILVLLSACYLPSQNPTQAPTTSSDMVFQTAQAAAAATLTQQALLVPSQTVSLNITDTVTPPAFTIEPPTSSKPMISVSKETNCRIGPDPSFERVGGLVPGVMAEVVALDTSRLFYYIRNPQNPSGFCWLWGYYATTVGDITSLPLFTPMPTPTVTITSTPVPNFSFVYTKVDSCVGWTVEVKVQNTGSTLWSSGSVIAKDNVTSTIITERKMNEFEDWNGCLSASSIQGDLAPTESGSLHSFDFLYNPTGHEILLTVKLFTADNMAGTCFSKQVTFTP
jgi:hypothetical protein